VDKYSSEVVDVDSWILDILSVTAPSASKVIMQVLDKLKTMRDDEAFRVITILYLAQIIEQNNLLNRKLDSANEALAVLLKRTEK
jgi:hypothetical protein